MDAKSLSVLFRRRADDEHLLIEEPSADEDRFVFELLRGPVTVAQRPDAVQRLVALAGETYGFMCGEHGELVRLCAPRDDLDDITGASHVIAWRHVCDSVLSALPAVWVDLRAWLDDQFLLEDLLHAGS